jgi:hypothetical protein
MHNMLINFQEQWSPDCGPAVSNLQMERAMRRLNIQDPPVRDRNTRVRDSIIQKFF